MQRQAFGVVPVLSTTVYFVGNDGCPADGSLSLLFHKKSFFFFSGVKVSTYTKKKKIVPLELLQLLDYGIIHNGCVIKC